MKVIKRFFDSKRALFCQGGKFARLHPLFEATETVFFIPGEATETGPNVRDSLDLKRFMTLVIVAALPLLFFGIYNAGCQSQLAMGESTALIPVLISGLILVLPIVVVTYGVGFAWEVLFSAVRGHRISEGFLVTGMLFPLTLPPTIPLWQVAVAISFGVVIGKEVFGGTGRNILNPALTARAFLFFAYPVNISGDKVWIAVKGAAAAGVDAVSGATPLAVAALTPRGGTIEAALDAAGYTFGKLFFGLMPGSIGETSAFLCLLMAVFLTVVGVASYRVIVGGVVGVLATGLFLNLFASAGASPWLSLNPMYHLVMGGFAFGITYMATDPVTGPGMKKSQWLYGFIIGALNVLIRVFNPAFAEGTMLAILFMNLFSPVFDHFEIRMRLKKRVTNV